MNKKGSMLDVVVLSVVLALLAISLPIFGTIVTTVNNEVQADTTVSGANKENYNTFATNYPSSLDTLFLLWVVASYLATFVLAFMIDSRPQFFFIAALSFTISILIVPFLANAWDGTFTGNWPLVSSNMTIIQFIMSNYLQITITGWALVIFGLYAKRQVT